MQLVDADGARAAFPQKVIPIHELLARIRWDPGFGRGRFEIAYLDHTRKTLVRLPLERVVMSAEDRFGFQAMEDDGSIRSVPYHRVRELWRDGELIWSRRSDQDRVR